MTVTVFGIRHHGPGCARSLRSALAALRPDLVLVEGPPDADDEIASVAAPGMVPPVALLVHRVDAPERASFYPFAVFSPEWQALRWAVEHGVPARFCDLPVAVRLADAAAPDGGAATTEADAEAAAPAVAEVDSAQKDPLQWLAHADGYGDTERWWNDRIEERGSDADLFAAILVAVGAVRDELQLPETTETLRREAWMRRALRAAQKEGFANIAFVCGAWHAPAMQASSKSADDALLQGLPKCKVRATWTPWTHGRLTSASGYGAGITSPGWYDHLWHHGQDPVPRWLVRAARLLRAKDLEASSASVIEATRLCEALASLRGRPRPGLGETLAAIDAVFGGGDRVLQRLLHRELLVGECLGELPAGIARLPLEDDITAQQKSLRLKPTAGPVVLELDLREAGGKARSVFLHRLQVLQLPWGDKQDAGRTRGTFKEVWQLQWRPEFALALVDAAAFGNTVATAAANRLQHRSSTTAQLPELVELLDAALLADLPEAAAAVLAAVAARAADTTDIAVLLVAVPPLVRVLRYGDVRGSDREAVGGIVHGLAERVHATLPTAAAGLDDEAAMTLTGQLRGYQAALELLAEEPLLQALDVVLDRLATAASVHAHTRGAALRGRRDRGTVDDAEVAQRLGLELSAGAEPLAGAHWLDGFLAGAGAILAHDPRLLPVLDAWVGGLDAALFQHVLPLVRRTFASFAPAERRQIAMALRGRAGGPAAGAAATSSLQLDVARAGPAVAGVAALLGLDTTTAGASA